MATNRSNFDPPAAARSARRPRFVRRWAPVLPRSSECAPRCTPHAPRSPNSGAARGRAAVRLNHRRWRAPSYIGRRRPQSCMKHSGGAHPAGGRVKISPACPPNHTVARTTLDCAGGPQPPGQSPLQIRPPSCPKEITRYQLVPRRAAAPQSHGIRPAGNPQFSER